MHALVKFLIVMAGLLLLVVNICSAEEAETDKKEAASYQLETLTVTARKKEEDSQKIPVSNTIMTDMFLEDASIDNMQELTRFAPSVYMKKSSTENVISMRGVTSFDTSVYSPTAMYVDDVMMPLHYSHNMDLVDIERVEVLRGPQGSLYGGNSLAGVINIITRKPDNELRLKLSGDAGIYTNVGDNPQKYIVSGSASGPIVHDHWYIGISGQFEKGDGFMTNLYTNDDRAGETDHKNIRGILRWTPDERWDVSFTGDVLDNDDRIGVYRFDTGPYRTDQYNVNHDTDDYQKEEANSQTLRAVYSGESLKVLSVTGRRDYKNNNLQDYDCTADLFYNWGQTLSVYDDRLFSQEIRLSSNNDGSSLSWLTGAYAFFEDTDIRQNNAAISQSAETTIKTEGYALFGEITYSFLNQLHLTGGMRYDVQQLKGKKKDTGINLSDEMNFNEFLPKVSLGYDLADTMYSYATVSKGYLAGGYNYSLATDADSFAYAPEYAWNYEVGLKTTWLDRKFQANIAIFYIQMNDKQVYELSGGSTPTTKVDNAAKAYSKGVELEIKARPAIGWDLLAGLGYIDAKYDDWIATEWNSSYTTLIQTDYSGKTLPNVPKYTGNLGVQYRHANGLIARVDLNAVGSLYADHNNNFKEDAYTLLNLHLGYETEQYDIVLWGKNIFDTSYHTIAYDWDGEKLVQDGAPAQFGIKFTLRY